MTLENFLDIFGMLLILILATFGFIWSANTLFEFDWPYDLRTFFAALFFVSILVIKK